jgi:hypothetical protein
LDSVDNMDNNELFPSSDELVSPFNVLDAVKPRRSRAMLESSSESESGDANSATDDSTPSDIDNGNNDTNERHQTHPLSVTTKRQKITLAAKAIGPTTPPPMPARETS